MRIGVNKGSEHIEALNKLMNEFDGTVIVWSRRKIADRDEAYTLCNTLMADGPGFQNDDSDPEGCRDRFMTEVNKVAVGLLDLDGFERAFEDDSAATLVRAMLADMTITVQAEPSDDGVNIVLLDCPHWNEENWITLHNIWASWPGEYGCEDDSVWFWRSFDDFVRAVEYRHHLMAHYVERSGFSIPMKPYRYKTDLSGLEVEIEFATYEIGHDEETLVRLGSYVKEREALDTVASMRGSLKCAELLA